MNKVTPNIDFLTKKVLRSKEDAENRENSSGRIWLQEECEVLERILSK